MVPKLAQRQATRAFFLHLACMLRGVRDATATPGVAASSIPSAHHSIWDAGTWN